MGSSNSKYGPFHVTKIDQIAAGNGAGAAAALPSLQGHTIVLQAICPAGQTIYVGRAADLASVTTAVKTYPMKDGQTLQFEVANANELCVFADAASAKLAYILGSYY